MTLNQPLVVPHDLILGARRGQQRRTESTLMPSDLRGNRSDPKNALMMNDENQNSAVQGPGRTEELSKARADWDVRGRSVKAGRLRNSDRGSRLNLLISADRIPADRGRERRTPHREINERRIVSNSPRKRSDYSAVPPCMRRALSARLTSAFVARSSVDRVRPAPCPSPRSLSSGRAALAVEMR